MVMSKTLQLILVGVMILYFVLLITLLKKKRISLKYSLLWIFSGIVLLVLAVFPKLLNVAASLVGIYNPMNALFAVVIFCIILLLISLTSIVSGQSEKNKKIVQELGLLEKRLRDLEENKISEELSSDTKPSSSNERVNG